MVNQTIVWFNGRRYNFIPLFEGWGWMMAVDMKSSVQGRCDPRFSRVERQFEENMTDASAGELGASLAVYCRGQLVIDIWGGHRDSLRQNAWQRDTPACVFSCTKGVVSIIAMRLVQADLLDYDEKVTTYWPEYGCHGKEGTQVKQLLSHQAGLPILATDLEPGNIWDWSAVTSALAASEPKWSAGSRHGYHALTWGYLVGSVLERAAGISLAALLQREVCEPLHVNFSFGLVAENAARAATLEAVSSASQSAGLMTAKALEEMTKLDEAVLLTPEVANSKHWRNALIPGANGHCSAVDLATIYQSLIAVGSAYVDQDILAQATATQVSGKDAVLKVESAYGMGFQLSTKDVTPGSSSSSSCWGHKGIYGATGFVDADQQLAVGYVMNRCGDMQGDERAKKLLASIYGCL
jgi:CubicO group peptidase (beta-lactamase class C family)